MSSPKCKIGYVDTPMIDLSDSSIILDIQKYNPIYSIFHGVKEDQSKTYGLNHPFHIIDLDTVQELETGIRVKKPVFIKFSPLLDPMKFMIGKYDMEKIHILPPNDHEKINDINNASYVDCFFSFLSSILLHNHGIVHGLDFYGSYLGIQPKFKIDVSDDLEYLNNYPFFKTNINKLFTITSNIDIPPELLGGHKPPIQILDTIDSIDDMIEIIDVGESNLEESTIEESTMEELPNETMSLYDNDSDSDSSDDSILNYTDSDEPDESDKSDESDDSKSESHSSYTDLTSEEDEVVIDCIINDFPVQMICLEKCDGTMDSLFVQHYFDGNESYASSALIQIIMTLIAYHRAFSMTHNDLHTNNIMYINTKIKYLYYQFNGIRYKVPTFGKIFKIIDFGRSIYTFQNQLFCSDSFAKNGDAATQYNFGPYMNNKKPLLEPNRSFDLCRLGCSIYDFIIDHDDYNENTFNPFQRMINNWCTDDNGKNILYMKNGEERYLNFKLYKMIARTVHHLIPENQLNDPFFSQYKISKKHLDVKWIHIDKIPSYTTE
jgi:hypothetical protein